MNIYIHESFTVELRDVGFMTMNVLTFSLESLVNLSSTEMLFNDAFSPSPDNNSFLYTSSEISHSSKTAETDTQEQKVCHQIWKVYKNT
jgi:hypothetical protein